MNVLNIVLIILGVIFGIAILIGVGIIIYLRGKKSIEDNPSNALIFPLIGKHFIKPFKGKLIDKNDASVTYQYDNKRLAIVPTAHEEIYYLGKRFLFMTNNSRIFPTALIKQENKEPDTPPNDASSFSKAEKETIIEELIESNVGGGAVNAIRGKGGLALNLILIVVALIIGVVGTYGVISFQAQVSPSQPAQPPASNQQVIPAK